VKNHLSEFSINQQWRHEMLRTSLKTNPFRFLPKSATDLVMLQEIAAAIAVPERGVSVSATYEDGSTSTFPALALPLVFRYDDVVPNLQEFRVSWQDALGVTQTRFVEPYWYGCPVGCDCGDDKGLTFSGWSVTA
jgi:hypothetical protein